MAVTMKEVAEQGFMYDLGDNASMFSEWLYAGYTPDTLPDMFKLEKAQYKAWYDKQPDSLKKAKK